MNKLMAILPVVCLLFLRPVWAGSGQAGTSTPDKIHTALRAIATGTPAEEAADSLDAPSRRLLDNWLTQNAQCLNNVKPSPLKDLPWGTSTLRPATASDPARLHLLVFDWHASGKLIAYGLTGPVRRAYLLSKPDQSLPIEKTPRSLILTVPKEPPDPLATVVVLELEGDPQVTPLAIRSSPDDKILLHARDVIVHGHTVRYEPEPHKNTVGYWMQPADWVRWPFIITTPGSYTVDIEQGCGKGHGGSTVHFTCNDQTFKVVVQDTGHFQNFVTRRIGRLKFDRPGEYTLEVRPQNKTSVAVMDLRSVTLTPAEKDER